MSALLLLLSLAADEPPVSRTEFDSLRRLLLPRKAATWESIPWDTDLKRARARAVRERKPLFMWAMNGHPMGCT